MDDPSYDTGRVLRRTGLVWLGGTMGVGGWSGVGWAPHVIQLAIPHTLPPRISIMSTENTCFSGVTCNLCDRMQK